MRIYTGFGSVYSLIQRGAIKNGGEISSTLQTAGLDGLEINSYVFDLVDRLVPDFSFSLEDLKGFPLSLHSNYVDLNPASLNPYVRKAAVEQLVYEIELCENYSIPILTIHPGWVRKIERQLALEFFWDSLSTVLDSVSDKSYQPKICLENMDHQSEKLCNNSEEIRATLDRFPQLGLTADLAHLGLTGAQIDSFLDDFAERIAHLHVSGVIAGKPHGSISLAASSIDFRTFFEIFQGRNIAAVIENQSWEVMIESRNVLDEYR
ncbi:MAG: TIM barrel protein [Spirochaetaceae bacterium]|nr:MAG: TIM barrel protein [Spirochaetaceae bacterium]